MRPFAAALVAGLSGFAIMSLELTAIRLLAPYFGDSAYVWTNVIGVMLVALALGAWLGGILGDRSKAGSRLALIFLLAALLAAMIPLLALPLGSWLLPGELPLDAATPALLRGSLAATLLLFAPPVLLIGMATPMLISLLTAYYRAPGRASGLVGASSTTGSLLGTFATTHLLVPDLGSRMTAWICAGMLVFCALLMGSRKSSAGVAAALLALCLVPLGAMRPPPEGVRLLAENESAYQFLQVVEQDDPVGGEMTSLKINEGLDSFHSVRLANSPYTAGRYYDFYTVLPFLAGDGRRPEGLRVLSLGAAAGTFERVLNAAHPGLHVDSVEIDPAVVELGRRYFGAFEGISGKVYSGLDARVFVEKSRASYHAVIVDAYERQVYIPAHVASLEFFTAVKDRLLPGGLVAVNAGGRSFEDPVVLTLSRTMASVFGFAHAFRVPNSRNYMLLARRDRELNRKSLAQVKVDDEELQAIIAAAGRSADWRSLAAEEPILRDDRPFLDQAQDLALLASNEVSGPIPMQGSADPDQVAIEARQMYVNRALEAARGKLSEASTETAYLRLLAGDCRWLLHDE
ncbi:MAG: spermidine synthase, partial [Planctomycetota bacterium]